MKNENTYYEELIIRYLHRECTTVEIQKLEMWVKENKENQKFFVELKKLNTLSSLKKPVNISNDWKTIQQKIQAETKTVSIESSTKRKTYLQWGIAAAIISILSLTFYLTTLNPSEKYKTQTAIKDTIDVNLIDNSIVDLDVGASLTYPDKFSDKRIVKLKGTAFFDIERDEEHPFIIETQNARIEVLGTSFLVKSDEHNTEVIVKTGKVSLSNEEQGEVILTVGDKGSISKHKIEKTVNKDHNFLSWKTKELIFKNDNLEYIIEKINTTYHSNLKIENDALLDCALSAHFKNQELDEILNVVSETLDLNIRKEGKTIFVSGNGCE